MMANADERALALIPAYNEARRIGAVLKAARRLLPTLVVDDGSKDDTAKLARAAGATVVTQHPNQGKGAALRTGFRWALERDYDVVITLDADGQHDPNEMPAFLASHQETRADLVIGARDFRRMPISRRIANLVGQRAFSWALGRPIQDNQSGYRLLSRRMMEALLDSGESGFEFEVEMIATCVSSGYQLSWVPIRTIYTGGPSHIRPWQHTIKFFTLVWQVRQRMRA